MTKRLFTKKEQEQHTKYGCKVLITLPNGEDKIFNSFSEASRILKINVAYGYKVCCSKPNFKNYIIKKLANPIIDCRSFKIKE